MMYDWNGGWGWGGWLAMGLVMLVFWGSIVALIAVLVRGTGTHREAQPSPPPTPDAPEAAALRILQERFARGEIDADEYEQRRKVLRSP